MNNASSGIVRSSTLSKHALVRHPIVAAGKRRSPLGSRSCWRAKAREDKTGQAPRTGAIISRRSHHSGKEKRSVVARESSPSHASVLLKQRFSSLETASTSSAGGLWPPERRDREAAGEAGAVVFGSMLIDPDAMRRRDEGGRERQSEGFHCFPFLSDLEQKKRKNEGEPMSSSLLSAALDDATRVVKKQKTTALVTAQAIEAALRVLEEAQDKCGGDGAMMPPSDDDASAILAAAAEALKGADASGVVAAATKDLHGAVGKLGKVRRKGEGKKKRGKEGGRQKKGTGRKKKTRSRRPGREETLFLSLFVSPSLRPQFSSRSATAPARALQGAPRPSSLSLSPSPIMTFLHPEKKQNKTKQKKTVD